MTDMRDAGALAGPDEAEAEDAAGPVAPAAAAVGTARARTPQAGTPQVGAGPGWLAPATGPATRGGRRTGRRGAGWRLGLVGVVLAAAVGFLLYKGIGTSLNYYVTVRQALAERGSLAGKTFRLKGIVVPGTISHHGTTVSFTISQPGDHHLQVPVVNHGNPPQLFKKGIPVIVQGHFAGSTFESTQLLVDHTGNYLPQRDGPRNPSPPAGPASVPADASATGSAPTASHPTGAAASPAGTSG